VIPIPEVVTHRYDPAIGAFPDLCGLSDDDAWRVLDRLRRKPGYLVRRRKTEVWLREAAAEVLGRRLDEGPGYFFLGDFSHAADPSRPAALTVPLSKLPSNATTFTLGDSMSVAEEAGRKVYSLDEVVALFASSDLVGEFGFTDRHSYQDRFIEVQLWDRTAIHSVPLTKPPRLHHTDSFIVE
jgi:hypothetical protein